MPDKSGSAFADAFATALSASGQPQTAIARAAGRSPQYVNKLARGRAIPAPEWIDLIADTLKASPATRAALHRAAARDLGYKLDLEKK